MKPTASNTRCYAVGVMKTITEAKVAQISNLNQETVIKFGNEILKLDRSEQILKLGLDLHYRQVTVAMQEDGRLVVSEMDQKEAGTRLADLQLLRSRRQWVLVGSQAAKARGGQPGGGGQSDGPRGKEAKDRSARQLSIGR